MERTVAQTSEDLAEITARIQQADKFGFDTESHGPVLDTGKGRKKSMLNVFLSDMTGFSLAFPEGKAFYVPVRHMKGKNVPLLHARAVLEKVSQSKALVAAHNWKHDAKVLQIEGIAPPVCAFDTLVAAWMLRPKIEGGLGLKAQAKGLLGMPMASFEETTMGRSFDQLSGKEALSYATDDAIATLGLLDIFCPKMIANGMNEHFWNVEMRKVFMLRDIEDRGLGIDQDRLAQLHRKLSQRQLGIYQEWVNNFRVDMASPSVVSKYFYDVAKEWTTDGFKRGDNGLYPANKEAIKVHLANCPEGSKGHTAARLLSDFRQVSILMNMFTKKLGRIAAQYPDGRLHPSLNQTGTETGRFSSSDPNAQQIPAHSELGKAVKACIVPAPGKVFVSADYSQLELRYLAHLCKSGPLFDAVCEERDLHQAVADEVGASRAVGKMLNFATVYGAGAWKLSRSLGVSEGEAQGFLDAYFKRFPQVAEVKRKMLDYAYQHEVTKTFTGRIRRLPGMRDLRGAQKDYQKRKLKEKHEKRVVNTCVQGSGADVVSLAMLALHERLNDSDTGIVMQVHDEILVECPKEMATEVAIVLQDCMETTTRLRVPLKAEPAIGSDWSQCK